MLDVSGREQVEAVAGVSDEVDIGDGLCFRVPLAALSRTNVYHRRSAASVFSRKRIFVHLNLVNYVGIDNAKNAKIMGYIVQGDAIQDDQVFISTSAADIQVS